MSLPSRYTAPESVDNWRHTRMLSAALPIHKCMRDSSWLTIGDGAFGSDASYIASIGGKVTASSLSDDNLKIAHEYGYIKEYQAENAERLSFADDAVDFILCKEAYHHLPRPPIGLYEMLRVARVAVVLIEPIEDNGPLDIVKTVVKRILRGDSTTEFEPSGNFIYRTSIRETEKLMTAVGLTHLAYKKFNDFYMPGLEGYEAGKINKGYVITRTAIMVQNVLCKLRLLGWGLATVVLFKDRNRSDLLSTALRRDGFVVRSLPLNPFLG